MAAVSAVTDATFDRDVLGSKVPFLVDFYADWCQPCKAIAPVVERAAAALTGKLRIGKLDIDANMAVPQRFGIMSIPTLILFKGGHPVLQLVGANDARDVATLTAKLSPHLE